MESLKQNLKYLIENEPEKLMKLEQYSTMQDEVDIAQFISSLRFGAHIRDLETYNKAINVLENKTGEPTPKWDHLSIKNKVNIDFEEMKYTCYDFAYWMNMKYSDYGEIMQDFSTYVKIAMADLDDEDYQGDSSERAFMDAMEKIKYKKHH